MRDSCGGINDINIKVSSDSFWGYANQENRYLVDRRGQVTLTEGWIPTETSMIALFKIIRRDRPDLKRLNFAIFVRCAGFPIFDADPEVCKQLFEFDYNTPGDIKVDDSEAFTTSVSRSSSSDVDALGSVRPDLLSQPEHRYVVNHNAISALYQHMLYVQEESIFDSEDDFLGGDDMETGPR
jgi:hypothetical protein